ncbi:MAG TPA: hypothetical protein VMB21_20695 [Candidatus Limnocylindria bacterium]|jgi:hypothetical protein|nr:hypothetical protein [Candidatus Limnocylindria bacterium]
MKTPREVLFAHHRNAQTKLDALRQEVLAELPGKQPPVQARSEVPWSFREFLRPFRWHLSGLSAAWLLVAVLNSEPAPSSTPSLANQDVPPPRQLLMAFREHRRQLWELLQPPVAAIPAVPHAYAPSRRSDPAISLFIA